MILPSNKTNSVAILFWMNTMPSGPSVHSGSNKGLSQAPRDWWPLLFAWVRRGQLSW
jgi:hypothetical protein